MEILKPCQHAEIAAKYYVAKYFLHETAVLIRIKSWVCKECGEHWAESEKIESDDEEADIDKVAC